MTTKTAHAIAPDLVTVAEYRRLVRDGEKADLIDGVIYMASPDSRRHDRIQGFTRALVEGYAKAKSLGEVFGSRFGFEVSDFDEPEPDVAFVSRGRLHLVHEVGMKGGPDIAVEIVSRESRHRDYEDKKRLYEEAGTQEYWIIDPLQNRVEFYRLAEGRYDLVPLEQNRIFRSTALEGFWLDIEWLLADPPPNAHEKLQEVLRGSL